MSDLPQQQTINQYIGDGVEDTFNYTYLVPTDVDIDVYVTPQGQQANDQDDIQSLGVEYIVTNTGVLTGGTIVFLPGFIPPNQSTVTLDRSVKASIDTNYADPKTIIGLNLDNSFQREMLVIQQNQTKFDDRSLRFEISSFLPDSSGNNIVPLLPYNYVWKGTISGKIGAFELEENPDCSTLRSELADENPGTNGASLVGYYDVNRSLNTQVDTQLNEYGGNGDGTAGSKLIGYYDNINAVGTNVSDTLDTILDGLLALITAGGTPNAIILTPTNPVTSYVAGQQFQFISSANNTGAATVNVSGLGPISIVRSSPAGLIPLSGLEIITGSIYNIIYNGTQFQLSNPSNEKVLYAEVQFSSIKSQLIPPTSTTKIEFDQATSDDFSWWNQGSFRFIPTIPGKYSITCSANGLATNESQGIRLYKNGTIYRRLSRSANVSSNSNSAPSGAIFIVDANGTSDYFEAFWRNDAVGSTNLSSSDNGDINYFQIKYEGS